MFRTEFVDPIISRTNHALSMMESIAASCKIIADHRADGRANVSELRMSIIDGIPEVLGLLNTLFNGDIYVVCQKFGEMLTMALAPSVAYLHNENIHNIMPEEFYVVNAVAVFDFVESRRFKDPSKITGTAISHELFVSDDSYRDYNLAIDMAQKWISKLPDNTDGAGVLDFINSIIPGVGKEFADRFANLCRQGNQLCEFLASESGAAIIINDDDDKIRAFADTFNAIHHELVSLVTDAYGFLVFVSNCEPYMHFASVVITAAHIAKDADADTHF